jgi:hypothetical protein
VTVAADSMMTFGDEKSLRPVQKIVVDGGCIYAASGLAILPALVAWHKAGADPHKLPVVDQSEWWNLLVIDADGGQVGMRYYTKTLPYPLQVDPPFGVGAGADYAIGAMDHGASAEEAVAIAIRRSRSCGGPVQSVRIADVLCLGGADPVKQAAE